MKSMTIRDICINAMIASVYFILTIITSPIAFMGVQFRIAEMLVFLCFFRKDYSIGLVIGCLLANLISPLGWPDIVFGTLATLLSCILVIFSKRMIFCVLFPTIINGLVVAAELYYVFELPYWMNVGLVALGEGVVLIVGYVIFMFLIRRKDFLSLIGANQNLEVKW